MKGNNQISSPSTLRAPWLLAVLTKWRLRLTHNTPSSSTPDGFEMKWRQSWSIFSVAPTVASSFVRSFLNTLQRVSAISRNRGRKEYSSWPIDRSIAADYEICFSFFDFSSREKERDKIDRETVLIVKTRDDKRIKVEVSEEPPLSVKIRSVRWSFLFYFQNGRAYYWQNTLMTKNYYF